MNVIKEFILFLFSWIFFRMLRCLLKLATLIHNRVKSVVDYKRYKWYGMSHAFTKKLFLHHLMLIGPRWNCFAEMGSCHIMVEQGSNLEICLADCKKSAINWTVVIYNDSFVTQCYLTSQDEHLNDYFSLNLGPGDYHISIRYYETNDEAVWPAFTVSNKQFSAVPIANERELYQSALNTIKNKTSWYFKLCHFHVCYMLKYAKYFSKDYIKKCYLPVGNPDTLFQYGYISKGQTLTLVDEQKVLESCLIYIVFLNTASFPIHWHKVEEKKYEYQFSDCQGTYLIRILPNSSIIKNNINDSYSVYITTSRHPGT